MKSPMVPMGVFLSVMAFVAWVVVSEWRAMEAERPEREARRAEWVEMHTVTPRAWVACREVCGDAAALLPVGDGSVYVTCSCLPHAKPVPSPGPK